MKRLVQSLSANGKLILSGIPLLQADGIEVRLQLASLKIIRRELAGEGIALVAGRARSTPC